jgi:uncharacterized protein YdhG (YjbR/CyaY superfamily)
MKAKQKGPATIDEYITDFPKDVRERLEKVRAAIRKAAPAAEEAIKYQMPTYVLEGNLIHFAGYEHHIGLYPGSRPIEKFKDELERYKTSKGTVQLPMDKAIPVTLIARITKYCVERNLERAAARKSKKSRKIVAKKR